ncbi:MAG: hypothetical protein NVS3B10_16900 [Polyangiales bacterium]
MAKSSIILTEDDESLRALMVEGLTDAGYDVVPLTTMALTRTHLLAAPSAVLLLDSPPTGHALGWLLDFVGRDDAPRTVIVSGSHLAKALGERFGVNVVMKPFMMDDLVRAIEAAAASQSRARDSTPGVAA